MKHIFIFTEQVQSLVRAGKNEIEIPAGARISSAAADLIKENNLQVKTIAPGRASADESSGTGRNNRVRVKKTVSKEKIRTQTAENKTDTPPANSAEISEDELEEIVSRVIARYRQLKGDVAEKPVSATSVKAESKTDAAADGDDLVICRCEEITRGEIKDAIRNGIQTLNGVKRITRAGMGLCQGQTCQQLVARILTEELGLSAADIDPTTARGPVRPLRLEVFARS
jgi:bacterioferritin-associated ferredoxin